MRKTTFTAIVFYAWFFAAALAGAETVLDNWDDAPRATTLLRAGKPLFEPERNRRRAEYRNPHIQLLYYAQKAGAFSLAPRVESLAGAEGFAFDLRLWGEASVRAGETEVVGWVRGAPTDRVEVRYLDSKAADLAQGSATFAAPDAEGWRRFACRLTLPQGAVEEVATLAIGLAGPLSPETAIDAVEIRFAGDALGVTERSVPVWRQRAAATREHRIDVAIEAGAGSTFSGRDRQILDQLWLGRDLTANNAALRDLYREEIVKPSYHALTGKMRIFMAYYELGSRGRFQPARLEPATEKVLLELLWKLTEMSNDIANARQSTWWLTSSENHDLNGKAANLISSRIFMDEPAYRGRVYPDLGRGPGFAHWQHEEADGTGPLGEGNYKDGKAYRAAEHYAAWRSFFDRYVSARAQHGIFLEHGSLIYMKYTLGFLHGLRLYGGDPELKRKVGQLLDIVWADWAQTQIGGVHGGPKTRHQGAVLGGQPMTTFARFFLGGGGTTDFLHGLQLCDDYQWPPVIWELALDSPGRGSYAVQQRGVGEEDPIRPRPAGFERSLLLSPEARSVRSSWVTPDYILGTQMDHPDLAHSHLNTTGRWQGLVCAGEPAARIVTCSTAKANGEADMEIVMQSVHHRTTLITQQARRWRQISPTWFPSQPLFQKPLAIFVGKAWDETAESDGWFFVREGNAYAAVRVVAGQKDAANINPAFRRKQTKGDATMEANSRLVRLAVKAWQWAEGGAVMEAEDKFSPVIIEAGRKADYGSFAAFQSAVRGAKLELLKTVVPGFYLLRYRGPAKDAEEIWFNAATTDMPRIAGQPVNYTPSRTFKSPFLATRDGGVIALRKGGEEVLLRFAPAGR